MMVAGLFLVAVTGLAFGGEIPESVLLFYLTLSAFTFVMYACDKAGARYGGGRAPERVLHGLALLGGWPGAAFAGPLLQHKTRKREFQVIFWIAVTANVGVFAWVMYAV